MKKLEHIGIAVKKLDEAVQLYEQLLNTPCYKTEEVEREQVRTAFFRQGETKIELLEGLSEHSAISQFIEKRGPGLHHIAFEVEDINNEMARLQAQGFRLLSDRPQKGADNKLICFVHPKSANGVLIELCQEIK